MRSASSRAEPLLGSLRNASETVFEDLGRLRAARRASTATNSTPSRSSARSRGSAGPPEPGGTPSGKSPPSNATRTFALRRPRDCQIEPKRRPTFNSRNRPSKDSNSSRPNDRQPYEEALLPASALWSEIEETLADYRLAGLTTGDPSDRPTSARPSNARGRPSQPHGFARDPGRRLCPNRRTRHSPPKARLRQRLLLRHSRRRDRPIERRAHPGSSGTLSRAAPPSLSTRNRRTATTRRRSDPRACTRAQAS